MVSNAKKIVQLIPIGDLSVDQQMRVLVIRNEESVRKWMYTDHIIQTSEHLMWISKLKHDDSNIVFAVIGKDKIPLGVVSVNAINWQHRRADWAFYLTSSATGQGLGSALEGAVLNFVFEVLGMKKLNAEVIDGNEGVLRLHKKFGFIREGIRREYIIKGNKRKDVILVGMSYADWACSQPNKSNWEVKIQLQNKSYNDSGIDAIEVARAKNNINWMGILRLALQRSPTAAKQIVKSIYEQDNIILNLTKDLVIE